MRRIESLPAASVLRRGHQTPRDSGRSAWLPAGRRPGERPSVFNKYVAFRSVAGDILRRGADFSNSYVVLRRCPRRNSRQEDERVANPVVQSELVTVLRQPLQARSTIAGAGGKPSSSIVPRFRTPCRTPGAHQRPGCIPCAVFYDTLIRRQRSWRSHAARTAVYCPRSSVG